ncbi:MAG: hypothetical protein HYS06_09880, partial [Methylocystis sp.]|nr:hypothetical protein [Methylocystis sp.]
MDARDERGHDGSWIKAVGMTAGRDFTGSNPMNLSNFRFETGADGIALAAWDMPGRSMNLITLEVMDELERV